MFSSKSFIVLALTFGSLIHFELTFWIWCEEGIPMHSLASGYPVVSAPFVGKNSFPNEHSWHPCEKNHLIINILVHFWPLTSIPLVYVSVPLPVLQRLVTLAFMFETGKREATTIFKIVLKTVSSIFDPSHFHMDFRICLPISTKRHLDF